MKEFGKEENVKISLKLLKIFLLLKEKKIMILKNKIDL